MLISFVLFSFTCLPFPCREEKNYSFRAKIVNEFSICSDLLRRSSAILGGQLLELKEHAHVGGVAGREGRLDKEKQK